MGYVSWRLLALQSITVGGLLVCGHATAGYTQDCSEVEYAELKDMSRAEIVAFYCTTVSDLAYNEEFLRTTEDMALLRGLRGSVPQDLARDRAHVKLCQDQLLKVKRALDIRKIKIGDGSCQKKGAR